MYAIYKNPPFLVSYKRALEIHHKALSWLEDNYDQWMNHDLYLLQEHQRNILNLYEYDWMERPYMLLSNLAEHELSNQIRQNLFRLYLSSQPTEDISLLISFYGEVAFSLIMDVRDYTKIDASEPPNYTPTVFILFERLIGCLLVLLTNKKQHYEIF